MIGLKKLTTAVAGGVMAVVMIPALANAATNTVTVLESDVTRQTENTPPTDNWMIYNRNAGAATFRDGPSDTPINNGSLELNTPTGADKIFAFNYDHIGEKLGDITAMSYSTYRSAGELQQIAAINLEIDYNGPEVSGGFTTLVFEPVYNTDQGAVVSGKWQTWDAYKDGDATWWSTKAIPGVGAFTDYKSWDAILAANPNATILGGFGVNQGSGNPTLVTAVDGLSIGTAATTTTYDFERVAPKPDKATNKDQCKNGGYKNFQANYKNQGDCVSAVASNDKAKGNPEKQDDFVTSFRKMLGL